LGNAAGAGSGRHLVSSRQVARTKIASVAANMVALLMIELLIIDTA
jgi:hypothetical protein